MKLLFVLVLLCLLVGVVSADTLVATVNYDRNLLQNPDGNATFSALRNGAGTATVAPSLGLWSGYISSLAAGYTDYYDYMYNAGISTNTTLPSGAIISGATLTVYSYDYSNGLGSSKSCLIDFTPASRTTFVAGDYDATTWTNLVDTCITPSGSLNVSATFTLNAAGIAAINKTGFTTMMFNTNRTIDNVGYVWASNKNTENSWRPLEYAGGIYAPYYTITYTPPDTTPPGLVTEIEKAHTCQNITFSWTNPVDADFNGINIYLNDVLFDTVDNTTTTMLFDELDENTEYEVCFETFDFIPNLGEQTCETDTTDICPTPTPTPTPTPSSLVVSFTSDVICGAVPLLVQFNDTTTGTPLSWEWLFGDGNSSVDQNPLFEYNETGLFTVNLTANNTAVSGSSNKTDYIRVIPNWAICPPTPSPAPTWGPAIMPTTDNHPFSWVEFLVSLWWLWLLIVLFLILVRR